MSVQLANRVGQLGDLVGHTLHMGGSGLLELLSVLLDLHGGLHQALHHVL